MDHGKANVDGLNNRAQAGPVTDDVRPLALTTLDTAYEPVLNGSSLIGPWESAGATAVRLDVSADSHTLINVDPLVLDLNGDGGVDRIPSRARQRRGCCGAARPARKVEGGRRTTPERGALRPHLLYGYLTPPRPVAVLLRRA